MKLPYFRANSVSGKRSQALRGFQMQRKLLPVDHAKELQTMRALIIAGALIAGTILSAAAQGWGNSNPVQLSELPVQ